MLSTTTKHDVFASPQASAPPCGPVHVFNPQSIGDVPSTFRWNPVDGCDDPATAIRRADAFAISVSQQGVEEATFWASKASDYLRAYFHAAALAGLDLTARGRGGSPAWTAPRPRPSWPRAAPRPAGSGPASSPNCAARRTGQRRPIRMTMSRALAFLADPALAASVQPGPGESFDIEEFLRRPGRCT